MFIFLLNCNATKNSPKIERTIQVKEQDQKLMLQLFEVIKKGELERVTDLLSQIQDVNLIVNGKTALAIAIYSIIYENVQIEILSPILDKASVHPAALVDIVTKININISDIKKSKSEAETKSLEKRRELLFKMLDMLLEKSTSPIYGEALFSIVDSETMEKFLDKGADINITKNGENVLAAYLRVNASYIDLRLVYLALTKGEATVKFNNMYSPIYYISKFQAKAQDVELRRTIIDLMLENGAEIDPDNKDIQFYNFSPIINIIKTEKDKEYLHNLITRNLGKIQTKTLEFIVKQNPQERLKDLYVDTKIKKETIQLITKILEDDE